MAATGPLTATNLALLGSIVPDGNNAINAIQEERAQLLDRALHDFYKTPEAYFASLFAGEESEESKHTCLMTSISNTYKPSLPTNASPMERFVLVSPKTGPDRLVDEQWLKKMSLSLGSVEDMAKRFWAAIEALELDCPDGKTGGATGALTATPKPYSSRRP